MSTLPSWARVGAKVVCVATSNSWEWTGRVSFIDKVRQRLSGDPVKGRIYTVTEVLWDDGYVCLRLKGFYSNYVASYFRPLVRIEDDIATHFSALLDVREPVEA